MKLIPEQVTNCKQVDYFGVQLCVPVETKCIATDADGSVYVYSQTSQRLRFFMGDNIWCYNCAGGNEYHTYLCDVDLEGMDWRDTLLEIE